MIKKTEENIFELSSRYYTAEKWTLLFGLVIVLYMTIGVNIDVSLPFINVKLQNQAYVPHLIGFILSAIWVYLCLEFRQSHENAKDNFLNYVRFAVATLWAVIALWLIYPELVQGTVYEGVSRYWYVSFLGVGIILGFIAQNLVIATLMIRNKNEASRLKLPGIPHATVAQYELYFPFVILLIAIYFILRFYAPASIVFISSIITGVAFLFALLYKFPNREELESIREVCSGFDRKVDIIDFGKMITDHIGVNSDDAPIEVQRKLREYCEVNGNNQLIENIELLEDIRLKPYLKDGNPDNAALDNKGFRITKRQKENADSLCVRVKFCFSRDKGTNLLIPIRNIEECAEKYFVYEKECTEIDFVIIFKNALTEVVLEELKKINEYPLQSSAAAGDIESVRELIAQGHDVNLIGAAGWTALHCASANGYPEIMKVLLDAGANPDVRNVLGLTPLIFGAKYGNDEVVKMLIDYGADINSQETNGNTALMKATQFGMIKVVDFLIQSGADITCKNSENQTALSVADATGHGQIARKLRKAGAKKIKLI